MDEVIKYQQERVFEFVRNHKGLEDVKKCMRELPTSAEGLPELQSAVISEEEVDY